MTANILDNGGDGGFVTAGDRFSLLHTAVHNQDCQMLALLLSSDRDHPAQIDMKATDSEGRTAINLAVQSGNIAVLLPLLSDTRAATSNAVTIARGDGLIPLHLAIRMNRY